MRNQLLLLVFFAIISAACGSKSGDSGGTVKAPVISGSANHGVLITAVALDQSIKTSRVYYYEFAAGIVREILAAESGDPAVFWADDRAFLFNRQADLLSVRTFNPKTNTGKITEPSRNVDGLTPGDPWDVTTLVAGKSVLLASPHGSKLQSYDYAANTLTDESEPVIRPVALLSSGGKIHALSSGVKDGETADGTQQIIPATVAADGSLTFEKAKPIHPSNPSGFLNNSGTTTAVVGLCAAAQSGCVAGADLYAPATGALSTLATFDAASVPFKYKNKVVNGPSPTSVYAHVETAAQEFEVVRLDLATKAASVVHKFPDYRLFGLAFDDGSKTLFVGGQQDLDGQLVLYRNDQPVGSIALDGVPYNFAFVPN